VWQHLDGRLEVRYQDQSLATFQPATNEPLRVGKFTPAPGQEAPEKKLASPPTKQPKEHKPHKPAENHPWRNAALAKSKQRKREYEQTA
jgi:hypothetical protein